MSKLTGISLAAMLLINSLVEADEQTTERVNEEDIQQIVGPISHELSVDLNGDNVGDRLIATTDCGNAGCTYFCFVRIAQGEYRFAGQIFLHRLGFEVLKTQHSGLSDILSYSRASAAEGSLLRHEFNGTEYEVTLSVSGNSALFDLLRPSIRQR